MHANRQAAFWLKRLVALTVACLLSTVSFAATDSPTEISTDVPPSISTDNNEAAKPVPRTSQSGYDRITQFGGPDGVSGQLRQNDELRKPRYDSDIVQDAWAPYFDWKRQLGIDHGLAFGFNGWLLYQGASAVKPDTDDNALGGIFRFQGMWKLMGRNGGNAGRIEWRVEARGNVGNNIAPATLGENVGAVGLNTGHPYNEEFDLDIAVLNWTQGFLDNRVGFAVGRLAFDAYLDAMPFQTPTGGFLNRGFFLNPTLPTTGVGALGLVAETFVSNNVRIGGQIYDANAKNGNWDYDTFQESEFIKAVELGWSPSIARHKTDLVQFTYWHKDSLDAATRAGEGWVMSATWKLAKWTPFFRYGNSNGGGNVAAKEYASTGFKLRTFFDQTLSAGAAWSKPADETLRDEYALEVSYIYQVSKNLSFTPDIQLIIDPADNPAEDKAWVFGIRALVML
jgi:porin